MKIDRPTIWTPPEPLEEKTGTPSPGKAVEEKTSEPVELQKNPSPKTDSVETKPASFYNFDNAPKLDPSQSIHANEVPAVLIPGVPFREKVELAKTLPDGTAVDGGVGSGDLGFGKTRPGPNHMGIDLKAGGTDIRNQLDEALKLREGEGSQSSAPPSGTVNYTGLAGKPGTSSGGSTMSGPGRTQTTYDGGFSRPGMGLISADKDGKTIGDKINDAINTVKQEAPKILDKVIDFAKDVAIEKFGKGILGQLPIGEAMTILDMPAKTQEITGDANDHVRGIAGAFYPENRLERMNSQDQSNQYVNPEAPEGTQPPVITEESFEKVGVRLGSNTQPGVEEYLQDGIDGSQLSETDPRKKLISNPNAEDQSSVPSASAGQVIIDAKGPDSVNPNDPELGGGGEQPILDPKRPG